ncbi:hypothetical protein DIPPA_33925 [Diplonema papillatum]|nr:hypothetical protein DIPPA_33925 [Diplonema papillatum]
MSYNATDDDSATDWGGGRRELVIVFAAFFACIVLVAVFFCQWIQRQSELYMDTWFCRSEKDGCLDPSSCVTIERGPCAACQPLEDTDSAVGRNNSTSQGFSSFVPQQPGGVQNHYLPGNQAVVREVPGEVAAAALRATLSVSQGNMSLSSSVANHSHSHNHSHSQHQHGEGLSGFPPPPLVYPPMGAHRQPSRDDALTYSNTCSHAAAADISDLSDKASDTATG